jgi:hypothetical protein
MPISAAYAADLPDPDESPEEDADGEPVDGVVEDDVEEESEDFLSACLASCESAPSLADWPISRLRFAVP